MSNGNEQMLKVETLQTFLVETKENLRQSNIQCGMYQGSANFLLHELNVTKVRLAEEQLENQIIGVDLPILRNQICILFDTNIRYHFPEYFFATFGLDATKFQIRDSYFTYLEMLYHKTKAPFYSDRSRMSHNIPNRVLELNKDIETKSIYSPQSAAHCKYNVVTFLGIDVDDEIRKYAAKKMNTFRHVYLVTDDKALHLRTSTVKGLNELNPE